MLRCGHPDPGVLTAKAEESHITGIAAVRPQKQQSEHAAFKKSSSIGPAHARAGALRAFICLLGEQQSHWYPQEPPSLARRCRGFNVPKFWRFQTDRRVTRKLGVALDKFSEAGPARFHWRGQHQADCRWLPECSLSSLEAALVGLPPMPCCIEKCWLKGCLCLWRPLC